MILQKSGNLILMYLTTTSQFSMKPLSDVFRFEAIKLHPTQMTLGYMEVDEKAKKMRTFSRENRHKYLKSKPIPVVNGPDLKFYLIDHHHMTRALLLNGYHHVYCYLVAHFHDMPMDKFWECMNKNKWVYPVEQLGQTKSCMDIPNSVIELKNDPYRSLAGLVRRQGAYQKCPTPFEEFKWAGFFRTHLPQLQYEFAQLESKNGVLENCLSTKKTNELLNKYSKEACMLAKMPEAAHLPGFIQTI